jgi:hypothetical protein
VVLAVFHTQHCQPADARSPFGKGGLQCEACHGPAGQHTKRVKKGETRPPVIRFGRDSEAPVAVQNGMCLNCHEKSMAASWHSGPHDAAQVSCASCHDSHARKDAVLAKRTQARLLRLPRPSAGVLCRSRTVWQGQHRATATRCTARAPSQLIARRHPA